MARTSDAWSMFEISAAVASAPEGRATVGYVVEVTGRERKTVQGILADLGRGGFVHTQAIGEGGELQIDEGHSQSQYELTRKGLRQAGFRASTYSAIVGEPPEDATVERHQLLDEADGEHIPVPRPERSRTLATTEPQLRALRSLRDADGPQFRSEVSEASGMREDALRKYLGELEKAPESEAGERTVGVVEFVPLLESGRADEAASPRARPVRMTDEGRQDVDSFFSYVRGLTSSVESRVEQVRAQEAAQRTEGHGHGRGPGGGGGMHMFLSL